MDEVVDVGVGGWIKPRLSGAWGTVTYVAPEGLSDYIRIFHPAMSEPDDEFHSWSQVAAVTGRTVHPQAQWQQIAGSGDTGWWPHLSPSIGRLDHALTRTLFAVLATHTTTADDCYFGVWEGSGWAMREDLTRPLDVGDELERRIARLAQGPTLNHPGRRYVLLHGGTREADAVGSHLGEPTFISAHLAWPADRAWYVATEVDYDSTIVACDENTATAILADPAIEAHHIPPEGRLDINADTVNPPR